MLFCRFVLPGAMMFVSWSVDLNPWTYQVRCAVVDIADDGMAVFAATACLQLAVMVLLSQ